MNITYDDEHRIFRLEAGGMCYCMGLTGEEGILTHLYFGPAIGTEDIAYLSRAAEYPGIQGPEDRDRAGFLDALPAEMPGYGTGDFRSPAVIVRDGRGQCTVHPVYEGHRITDGKPVLSGLPATFAGEQEAKTLEITLTDPSAGVRLVLSYSVFDDLPVVTRSVVFINDSPEELTLTRLFSCSVDMDLTDARMLTLNGAWGREKKMQISPVVIGQQSVSSLRGVSSHQAHPFLGLLAPGASQDAGEVYGFSLVYSGNFLAQVERNANDLLRVQLGIHPLGFSCRVAPGECFTAPEAVMIYSDRGLTGMTHTCHALCREHLIRSRYLHRKRPVLINNWEATFFDFDLEKLLKIARRAKKEGLELLVMDDGWFGKRDDDNSSLGDWVVNEKKLPGGLKRLSDELAAIGMKFGIWVEPEMVSPDSDLYRAHPDWAFSVDGRTPCRARNQYVLDLTRKEVRDAIFDQLCAVLDSADIAYVKWDMNRALTDVASHGEGGENGGLFHRFILGTYDLQERLLARYPDLLLENCSSGGGRFDMGMLFYSPQIWTSDDTDAIERLAIQEGTALLYPLSTMGAHISVSPSQAVGRLVPMTTRGHVALAGTFGYELDIDHLPEADAALIPGQVALYHRFNDLIREGDYYRIFSAQEEQYHDSYIVVEKDRSRALMTWVQVLARPAARSVRVRIPGLDPDGKYRIGIADPAVRNDDGSGNFLHEGEVHAMRAFLDRPVSGRTLAGAGILIPVLRGDFRSMLLEFVREQA
ncbi:MAG: alpha-galactosidase [Lachnospiraceae bacterium]|nr:alpha-galactosidase [Lachnospiraceae bacterium]